MLSRRYALIGWVVWQVGKRAAKKRARSVVPGSGETRWPSVAAVASGLAAAGALVWFWRSRRGDDHEPEEFG